MDVSLQDTVLRIVRESKRLVAKHTTETSYPVNYACIFSYSNAEYGVLLKSVQEAGKNVKNTPTSSVFQIKPLQTAAGLLRLLKIRNPDLTRTERGDADFTLLDFLAFKAQYFIRPGFSLIERPEMEMIELVDSAFDVRAYFSHPSLAEQLGIR